MFSFSMSSFDETSHVFAIDIVVFSFVIYVMQHSGLFLNAAKLALIGQAGYSRFDCLHLKFY